jgi:polyvinyl alcohol dehydrogenase (cytochrome)
MKKTIDVVVLVAGLWGCLLALNAARAQAPAQPQTTQSAAAQAPAKAPEPSTVTAPGTETGIAVFQQHCMSCHGNANVPQAPAPSAIREMTPERIYDALTTGTMKAQGASLTDDQRRMTATFLSGRPLGSLQQGDAKDMPNRCASNPPMADPSAGPAWNGWGGSTVTNTRFQSAQAAGMTAADVPKLKLKWAFGYPNGLSAFSQPAVVSGRVFVGTDIGYVYSLDAETGCVYWSYQTKGSMRTAPSVAPVKGRAPTKYAVYVGDIHANIYALDAQDGHLLWMTHVDDHFISRITGAPTAYNGRVYVPVSTSEEYQGSSLDYPCCTFRGSLVALDGSTGEKIWKAYTVGEPKPIRKNSKGVQLYAPSGGGIWSAPTVDAERNAIYVGTADGQYAPVPDTTDAIVAFDLDTGKIRWVYQVQAGDGFLGGCNGPTRTDNCPPVNGPDLDIGNSPILRTLPGGKRVVVAGTKDAYVVALDPDRNGALLWKVNVVPPPAGAANSFMANLRGIVWGGAADDRNVYYGVQAGGMVAVDLATGKRLWYTTFAKSGTRVSNSAAATAMPGVAFVAGSDGKLHALSTADGRVLWEYDTARNFQTVNKVPAKGGAINSIGPSIVGGMLFVGSGYAVVGRSSGNVLLAFSIK